jgi:hypothetical protein
MVFQLGAALQDYMSLLPLVLFYNFLAFKVRPGRFLKMFIITIEKMGANYFLTDVFFV